MRIVSFRHHFRQVQVQLPIYYSQPLDRLDIYIHAVLMRKDLICVGKPNTFCITLPHLLVLVYHLNDYPLQRKVSRRDNSFIPNSQYQYSLRGGPKVTTFLGVLPAQESNNLFPNTMLKSKHVTLKICNLLCGNLETCSSCIVQSTSSKSLFSVEWKKSVAFADPDKPDAQYGGLF